METTYKWLNKWLVQCTSKWTRLCGSECLAGWVQVLLRLAEDDRFVEGVAGEPDYEEPVLRKAHHILTSKQLGEYEHAARLDNLIAQVRLCPNVCRPSS